MSDHSLFGDSLPLERRCSGCREVLPIESFSSETNSRCLPCNSQYWFEFNRKHPFRRKLTYIKARAKAKGIPCELTEEYLEELWTGTCPVFETPLSWPYEGESEHNDPTSKTQPSLDRIIPAKGYVPGNVVWLSALANTIKTTANAYEVLAVGYWLKGVQEYE